jgi:hypothetical protein
LPTIYTVSASRSLGSIFFYSLFSISLFKTRVFSFILGGTFPFSGLVSHLLEFHDFSLGCFDNFVLNSNWLVFLRALKLARKRLREGEGEATRGGRREMSTGMAQSEPWCLSLRSVVE